MNHQSSVSKTIIVVALLSLFILTGFRCTLIPEKAKERIKPIVLNWWRVADGPDTVTEIIKSFHQQYSHININYQQFRSEEYEQALLEAWAEDRGPDIFSIPNTWLGKYQGKILPLPPKITIGRQIITGTVKKTPKIIIEEKKTPTDREIRGSLVETVVNDVYRDSQIWGLPMSMDTLVLYYNRNLLNQAKIVEPPQTWEELINDVRALTFLDSQGKIVQSGIALGTSNNISHAAGILVTLMMQNGTRVSDSSGVKFNLSLPEDQTYFPGEEAVRFYTDFANPAKETYSWNKSMPEALTAFIQGKTAFYFGYAEDLPKIRSLAPTLNFDLTKMPQITSSLKEINIADYWLETVSKKTKYLNEAWAFVLFATDTNNVKSYLERSKRPTALRSLIKTQLEDFDLAPFVGQILTAQSWYRGKNWSIAEKAIKDLIDDVVEGRRTPKEALGYYVQIINQTY